MVLKEDQERVQTLLKDTITLLCRNGLAFKSEFSVEALIGITLDREDVFLVNINEIIKSDPKEAASSPAVVNNNVSTTPVSPQPSPSQSGKKRRKRQHTDPHSWSHSSEFSSLEDSSSQEVSEPAPKRVVSDIKPEPEDSWDEIEEDDINASIGDDSQDGYSGLASLPGSDLSAQQAILAEGGMWSEHYQTLSKEETLTSQHDAEDKLDGETRPKPDTDDVDLIASLYKDVLSHDGDQSGADFSAYRAQPPGGDPDNSRLVEEYRCEICDKRYMKRDGLVRHWKVHDTSLHRCKSCTLFFTSAALLESHIASRHGTKSFKHTCDFCHKKFDRPFKLHKHLQICHNEVTEGAYT